jgi:hypothetical protein
MSAFISYRNHHQSLTLSGRSIFPVEQAARKCEPASTSGAKYSDPGLGVSLVFLLAKTSDEFNKMVKVRTEMEALLEEVRLQVSEANGGGSGHGNMPDEAPRNDPESTTSSCVTDRNDRRAGARMEERAVSPGTEAASCEKSEEECCGMVDGLEDEVQADLERLQVTHGSHVPLFAAEEEIDSEVWWPPCPASVNFRWVRDCYIVSDRCMPAEC